MLQKVYDYLKKSPLEHNRKLCVILLLTLVIFALIPRIAGLWICGDEFYHNDGTEYRDIAEQLSKGNGFSVTYYRWYEAVPDEKEALRTDFNRPPLFPLLGASLFLLPFDWDISARITALLLSAVCIIIVFLLGKEVFSSCTVGFLAAGIYAFYPYAIHHSLFWSSENLFLILLCTSWIFLIRAVRNDFNWKYSALCGGFLALANLTRPQGSIIFILLGLTAACYFFRNLRKEKIFCRKLFCGGMIFSLTVLLVFLPWMIRNWRYGGTPTPFTYYGAYSLTQAFCDISFITYKYVDQPQYKEKTDEIWERFHKEKREFLKGKGAFSPQKANPYWNKWAKEYILNHPEKAGFIIWRRILHCFRASPNIVAIPFAVVIILRIYFTIFLVLILCGLWYSRKNLAARSMLLPPLGALILAVPFLMVLRYRYPFFAPFAAVLAAYGCYELIRTLYRKKHPELKDSDSGCESPEE